MFKKIKEHLEETEWSYIQHLMHSVKQSNRLIVVAIKSYIHGLFPFWFRADGPITIFKMYHEIKKIRHIKQLEKEMIDRGEL